VLDDAPPDVRHVLYRQTGRALGNGANTFRGLHEHPRGQ
jgi:hypothetical protein